MDLSVVNRDNLEFMLTDLKKRLKIVNASLIDSDDFSLEAYDGIRDIYELVRKRSQLTTMEIEGILSELGELRRRK